MGKLVCRMNDIRMRILLVIFILYQLAMLMVVNEELVILFNYILSAPSPFPRKITHRNFAYFICCLNDSVGTIRSHVVSALAMSHDECYKTEASLKFKKLMPKNDSSDKQKN